MVGDTIAKVKPAGSAIAKNKRSAMPSPNEKGVS